MLFLAAVLISAASYAGIVLPDGYEEVKVSAPGTHMYVNKASSAFIAVSLMPNSEKESAVDAMKKILSEITCSAEIKGNYKIASVQGCIINAVPVDLGIIVSEKKMVIFQTSSNVRDEDFKLFLKNFITE
jgi:hypothetical protein